MVMLKKYPMGLPSGPCEICKEPIDGFDDKKCITCRIDEADLQKWFEEDMEDGE